MSGPKCFACGKSIRSTAHEIGTRDGQTAYVGPECFKLIVRSGETGYQPPKGGPRLFQIAGEPK
jgi:hypothetical protein